MAEIIGVRFKEVGKVYYFDPLDNKLNTGDRVIVETARGLECGEVATPNKTVDDAEISHPLKPLIRIATEKDLNHLAENKLKEKEAYRICEQKIANHKLEMKLVNVEYTFDNSKILFYFTADGRVDFRALVKDLASVFRTRIELRQIGVRDEAKMLGGLGICGKPFCCASFMGEFQPVSIKMAKEQGLSLSPVKISGTCGRCSAWCCRIPGSTAVRSATIFAMADEMRRMKKWRLLQRLLISITLSGRSRRATIWKSMRKPIISRRGRNSF